MIPDKFRPQLIHNDEVDFSTLDYSSNNYIAMIKRDGVRCELTRDSCLTRGLKPFRNRYFNKWVEDIQLYVKFVGDLVEGEIYSDTTPCRELAGILNSDEKELPPDLKFYAFDRYHAELPYGSRRKTLEILSNCPKAVVCEELSIPNYKVLSILYEASMRDGYEGLVLYNLDSRYKRGRVTKNQSIAHKMKPSKEEDLLIVGVTERMENTNESKINELGNKFKRNTVGNKLPTGIAACFIARMPGSNETTKVTITGEEEFRRSVWENQEEYINKKYVVVKSMNYGAKDKPRFPRMTGLKESCEK